MKEQDNGRPDGAGEVQGREEERQGEAQIAPSLAAWATVPITVTLRLPGPEERGFLRRIREVQAIMDLSKSDGVLGVFAMWAAFANWLADKGYVQAPDGVDPHEAVQELSRGELNHVLNVMAGIELPKAVDPPNGA